MKGVVQVKGYMLIDTEIFDQEVFAEFAVKIVEAMEAHGGSFLARGGTTEVMDGDWEPHRIVIMEFDSFERAQGFVRSEEYEALQDLRARCMHARVILVEGV